jgi:hypothetical protein
MRVASDHFLPWRGQSCPPVLRWCCRRLLRVYFKTSIRVAETDDGRAETKESLWKNHPLPIHATRSHQVLKCALSLPIHNRRKAIARIATSSCLSRIPEGNRNQGTATGASRGQ